MSIQNTHTKGLIAGVFAHLLWGSAVLFWSQLHYLNPLTTLSQRMIWSAAFILLYLCVTSQIGTTLQVFRHKKNLINLFLAATFLCINWTFFLWAVINAKAIDASLGYYITPIINILMGRIFLKETLNNIQIFAISIASLAVILGMLAYGKFPAIALILAFSFAFYGFFQKTVDVAPVPALCIELLFVLPFAGLWLYFYEPITYGLFGYGTMHIWILFASILFTGVPLMLFSIAIRHISLTTIGFLQYVSPTLNFLCAVFILHEPIKPVDYITFPLIWFALLIYTWDAINHLKKLPKPNKKTLYAHHKTT